MAARRPPLKLLTLLVSKALSRPVRDVAQDDERRAGLWEDVETEKSEPDGFICRSYLNPPQLCWLHRAGFPSEVSGRDRPSLLLQIRPDVLWLDVCEEGGAANLSSVRC